MSLFAKKQPPIKVPSPLEAKVLEALLQANLELREHNHLLMQLVIAPDKKPTPLPGSKRGAKEAPEPQGPPQPTVDDLLVLLSQEVSEGVMQIVADYLDGALDRHEAELQLLGFDYSDPKQLLDDFEAHRRQLG